MGRPGPAEIAAVLLGFYGEKIALIFYLSIAVLLFLSFKIWSAQSRSVFLQDLKEHFKTKSTLAFILMFVLTIFIPFLVGQFKPIFGQTRFTIIALPVFAIILSSLLYKFVNRTILPIFCVFLLCLVGYSFIRYYNQAETCSDRNATAELLKKAERGDVFIFTSLSRTATEYYLHRFNAAGNFVEFTFPRELASHPGWRNNAKMLEKKESLDIEAENLTIELKNLMVQNPRQIWLFYGLDTEVGSILKNHLDRNFVQTDKIDVSCAEAAGNQSDKFYTETLLYRINAD